MPDGESLIQPCLPGRSEPFAVGIDDLSRAPYMCVGVCVGVCACVIAVVSLALSLAQGVDHCPTELSTAGLRERGTEGIDYVHAHEFPSRKVSRYPCAVFTLHTHTHTHTRARCPDSQPNLSRALVFLLLPVSDRSSRCSSSPLSSRSLPLPLSRAPNGGA
jgi:hypothetical protein